MSDAAVAGSTYTYACSATSTRGSCASSTTGSPRRQPPGLSVAQATDILWTYSSPEVYDLLVIRSGWNLQQYATFISAGLAAHLDT